MLFSSSFFLTFFLPIVLLSYWLAPNRFRNPLLLFISLSFYAWGEPLFVFVLICMTAVNFWFIRQLDQSTNRKRWLIGYLVLNIGFLVAFKYVNFIVANLGYLAGQTVTNDFPVIPLPLGISFYAFHAITYGIDVYRRTFSAQNRIDDFALYLFLFPHQIAGPIVTYQSIAAEIQTRTFNVSYITEGMYRFTIGLAKKVILSNGLILLLKSCQEQQLIHDSSTLVWVEIVAYTLHIYFDFSGYSDMAIGLGRIFGFHFPENFNKPYTSKSITEFWQRWHKSLGYFMKNYLYIPLGGNRLSAKRTYFNLFIVFFLSGLWHGASWNFVLWGMFHGCWLILERLFLGKWLQKAGIISVLWTILLVMHGWVFFHEVTLTDSISTFKLLWSFDFQSIPIVNHATYFMFLLAIGIGLIVLEFFPVLSRWRLTWTHSEKGVFQLSRAVWMVLLYVLSYAYIVAGSYNPFIYFNF